MARLAFGDILEPGMFRTCWRPVGLLAVVLWPALSAHDIITTNLTYTRDISRIFSQRCASCHSENASIPLTNYEDTRPWAVAIKEQVLARTMPPWGAVKGFGDLAPDGALSQEEIMIISAWVIGGAPKGDPQLLQTKSSGPLVPAAPAAASDDGPKVGSRLSLKTPIRLAGIRPLTDTLVPSTRITAVLPDGRQQPLVWLYKYDPHYAHSFTFRTALDLPARTIIQSSAPLTFVLEEAKGSSQEP